MKLQILGMTALLILAWDFSQGRALIEPTQTSSGNQERSEVLFPDKDFLNDYAPINPDGTITAVIEIPAGTNEKWEVKYPHGHLERDVEDGRPRTVQYLGYPGNYGMIPRTKLSKEIGGDGDPLDVLVIGGPLPQGSAAKVKLIGVFKLMDKGERDDKMIAVLPKTAFEEVESIEELDERFPGITTIIQTWFANYKGPGKIEIEGFGTLEEAWSILDTAVEDFKKEQGINEQPDSR